MEQKKFLYSTGAFAKMNGINKRTLHYYDDIGLFSPEYKADNGYRYYTCFQTAQLEMILILRSVGLSIDEIRQYTQNPSGESFENMVRERKELLDWSLRQLMEVRQFFTAQGRETFVRSNSPAWEYRTNRPSRTADAPFRFDFWQL